MTDTTHRHIPEHAASVALALRRIRTGCLRGMIATQAGITNMLERGRQRRALDLLDDRLLRDIGVSPEQARREAAKLFWQSW